MLCRTAHFGILCRTKVVTIYSNWNSPLGTIIIHDEVHSGNEETSRIRPGPLPRQHRPGRKEPRCCPEEEDFHAGGGGGRCLLYSERESAAHGRIENGQGSHHRHIERGEFLWRRLVGWPGSPDGISSGHDGLPTSADREEGDDGSPSPRTRSLRHVRGVFAGSQYPL